MEVDSFGSIRLNIGSRSTRIKKNISLLRQNLDTGRACDNDQLKKKIDWPSNNNLSVIIKGSIRLRLSRADRLDRLDRHRLKLVLWLKVVLNSRDSKSIEFR